MKTLLFAQPSLQPPGGGNGLGAWMLEALREDYRVTVLTWRAVDFDAINRYWGTTLEAKDFEIVSVPGWYRAAVDWMPLPIALLKNSMFQQFASRLARPFDLVVTAANESDFGRSAIQYVHYPAYDRPRPAVDIRWYHGSRYLLNAYYWLCDRIHHVSTDAVRNNLTLVNSDWTGDVFCRKYGHRPRTLYPPVSAKPSGKAWAERKVGFVCLGRIAPEKDIDMIIDIVSAVRQSYPQAQLHVIGSPGEPGYFRRIMKRIDRHREWITPHLDIPYVEVQALIAANRYGIHAMPNEHFGMAPAEMAAAGCIVWVRDDGGQMEIVNRDPRLVFESVPDALRKILAIMENDAEQGALRMLLAERAPLFSVERFMDGVRQAASDQLLRQDQAQRAGPD